ncbi:VOC family protein [Viridibacillus sp. FSL R5-0477]|uniref:Glyoxalase/bleomycin resistance protein/dioxygenase n=1 Tax=Viridibacillus arenosi FSL R5-213 TaxID=1227360 RepID=W4EN72_9BACL|nr:MULTISPECIES: VOC family protein [Viridibacillus]ETT81462.1 Glyoxalase/bleomycin resistance protein/dioxygenase [Viridibacillus arenosi FSL R5-213]OMC80059.1 glyoxalase [Viridibacillus sp. FSL H8-0123]OMC84339.1 glyoxalase [Viridibacillus sp. FSL H7-0596]OMC89661.1 glyoxalase [Viridibacillus arenosi]
MSFVFKSIAHIQLAAPKGSEDKAKRFFSDILGFREIAKPELLKKRGGVWFEFAHYQIHIGIEEPFTPAKKAHPAFEIENIEALKSHLSKNDIKFINDDDLPGANRIYINDPFGNRIEILEWL